MTLTKSQRGGKKEPTETVSIDEAAQLLDCEPPTIMEALRAGKLPGIKFGRGWVIPREAFFAWLNKTAVEEATARRVPAPGEWVPVRRRRLLP